MHGQSNICYKPIIQRIGVNLEKILEHCVLSSLVTGWIPHGRASSYSRHMCLDLTLLGTDLYYHSIRPMHNYVIYCNRLDCSVVFENVSVCLLYK